MSLFNFFRGVFGFPPEPGFNRKLDLSEEMPFEFRNPMWNLNDDDSDDVAHPESNISLFSDPFGMHKLFEREMVKILQSFGLTDRSLMEPPSLGDMPEYSGESSSSPKSLRDEYLKPSFEMPSAGTRKAESFDNDIDDKATAEDVGKHLSSHLGSQMSDSSENPFTNFSGQIVDSKTITRPDGSVEIYRSVSGSQGNEVTVTRKGNGWTMITKRFSYGNL